MRNSFYKVLNYFLTAYNSFKYLSSSEDIIFFASIFALSIISFHFLEAICSASLIIDLALILASDKISSLVDSFIEKLTNWMSKKSSKKEINDDEGEE